MANGEYFVKAVVTNYLGATTYHVLAFTKAASGTAPVIVPLATGSINYKVAEGVRVGVQLVAASVCSGKQVRQKANHALDSKLLPDTLPADLRPN